MLGIAAQGSSSFVGSEFAACQAKSLRAPSRKSRRGPSGWKKYNAWRSETGQRIDPYVRKRPSGSVQPAHNAKRSDSAVAERIRLSQDSAVAEGVTIHVATPSQESAVAEGVTIHAATPSQEPAVAEGVPLHVANTVAGLRSCGRGLAP